jgi:hypothetical protein
LGHYFDIFIGPPIEDKFSNHHTGFVRGLKNLKSFGNLNLLVPGLEVLEIWENPIKSHGLLKVMDIGILVMAILFFQMFI